MAEVHILGTLLGATQFPKSDLCCKFSIVTGENWKLLEGIDSSQTQVDCPRDPRVTVWDHPIDAHYSTKSMEGWPKLQFQVFHQDSFGRNELYGYGLLNVPTVPGTHQVECLTWRPAGSFSDRIWSYFLGATPQLKNLNLIHDPTDRYRLVTESMGKISLELTVICRNFNSYGVKLKEEKLF